MSASLTVTTLGLPAMFAAGLASSAHCALMCGLLQARDRGIDGWTRHGGRLLAYALLGAIAGGAGHWLLRLQAWIGTGELLRLGALLVLAALLLRAARAPVARTCCAATRDSHRGRLPALLKGFVGGVVPCALLYAAALYAVLSASAAQGALLMLAFGVGTVPAVSAGAWAWRRFGSSAALSAGRPWRYAAVALSAVLVLSAVGPLAASWCRP